MAGYGMQPPYGPPVGFGAPAPYQNSDAQLSAAVAKMSTEELNKHLNDEDLVLVSAKRYANEEKWQADRASLQQRNEAIATENISKRDRMETGKEELLRLIDQMNMRRDGFNTKVVQYQSIQDSLSVGNVIMNLRVGAAQLEEESERLAEQYIHEGDVNMDDFIKRYMELKKLQYLRKIKEEKLQQTTGARF